MAMTLDQFMVALFGQEAGGDPTPYDATNGRTGAYGKYQILPPNWPAWSSEAGIPGADFNNPQAQERVARFKIQQYFNQYGNWEDVASAWYSGQPMSAYTPEQLHRKQGPNGDEPSIYEYVTSVMAGGGNQMAASGDFYTRYSAALQKREDLLRRWSPLSDKFEAASGVGAVFDPALGLVSPGRTVTDVAGNVVSEEPPRVWMTPDEYQTYVMLDGELITVEDEIAQLEQEYEEGGEDIDEFIQRQNFNYDTDPRNVDAQNSADAFAREMDVRTSAVSLANQRLNEQNAVQESALDDFNRFTSTSSFGQVFRAPRTHMPTADQLFDEAVQSIKKGLPEVTPKPYYEGGALPESRPPLSGLRGSILNQPSGSGGIDSTLPSAENSGTIQMGESPDVRPWETEAPPGKNPIRNRRFGRPTQTPKWPPEQPVYKPTEKNKPISRHAPMARGSGWGR